MKLKYGESSFLASLLGAVKNLCDQIAVFDLQCILGRETTEILNCSHRLYHAQSKQYFSFDQLDVYRIELELSVFSEMEYKLQK